MIIAAAYRFYRTKCEENSAKKSGKDETKRKIKRRHEEDCKGEYTKIFGVFTVYNFLTETERKKFSINEK